MKKTVPTSTQVKVNSEAPRPKRPAGPEIQRPKFKKFEEGDSIEGMLLGLVEVNKYKSEEMEQRYVLLTDDGTEWYLPNGADLVREKHPLGKLVLFVKKYGFGARIYIKCTGERETGQGKTMKEYSVWPCGATVTKPPTKVGDTLPGGQLTSVPPQPEAAGSGPDSGQPDLFEAAVPEE